MKTLYINRSGYIAVDTEENVSYDMQSQREAINRIFIADEPMHIVYDKGEKHYEADAKKGDLIITFYDHSFEKPVIVVKSKDWFNNLKKYNDKQQKEAEAWAKASALKEIGETPSCEGCDNSAIA